MSETKRRGVTLRFRVSPEEDAEIRRALDLEQREISEVARGLTLRWAKGVLRRRSNR